MLELYTISIVTKGFEVIEIAADGDGNKERVESILKKTDANWSQRLDKGANGLVRPFSI